MNPAAERMLDLMLEEEVGGLNAPDLRDALLERVRSEPARRRRLPLLVAGVAALVLLVWVLWPGQGGGSSAPLGAKELADIDGWLGALRSIRIDGRPHTTALRAEERRCFAAEADLLDLMAAHPAAWSALRPKLDGELEDVPRPEVRARLVRVYARDPRPGADTVLAAQLAGHGAELDQRTLIVLAERGLQAARERLLAAPPSPGFDFLPAALWLALHGPPPVREQARSALALGLTMTQLLDVQTHAWMAGALVLHRGGAADAWQQALDAVAQRVDALVARGGDGVPAARRLVLMWAWFDARRDRDEALLLGDLRRSLRRHVRSEAATLPDAAAIRRRLELLRR